MEALPGVLGNRGKGVFISGEQGNKGQNFEGNMGTKTILGNREHKITNFGFFGNRGTSQFISGEQGNRYPPPPLVGPHHVIIHPIENGIIQQNEKRTLLVIQVE